MSSPWPRPSSAMSSRPVRPELERAQRLLQALGEGAADRHHLADRFHRGGQRRIGAGKLLEGKARDFGDDIVDRRLERGRRRAARDVVLQLVQRVADRQPGRDLGDRKAGRLGSECRGARHARVHLDDDEASVGGIDGELHVRPAGLDPDLAQHRDRGVAHHLVFLVGERQRRRHRDRVARVHAHRIDVLDRADDDAVVRLVADDLHLELFPAEHAFLDQHLSRRRGVEPALDDLDELLAVVGDAAAGAAERERRTDDGRQPHMLERRQRLRHGVREHRARRFEPYSVHRLAEELAVLGLGDRFRLGTDHLDAELGERAQPVELERRVERRLSAHRRQQRVRPLLLDDLGHHLRRDRLDVGCIRQLRIGHDRGRIGIDEDDPVALGLQRLAGLGAGIVELARLADHDGAGADDEDRGDVGAFRHAGRVFYWSAAGLAIAQRPVPASRERSGAPGCGRSLDGYAHP